MDRKETAEAATEQVDQILRIVHNSMIAKGWSVEHLAKKSGVPVSTLRAWLGGKMAKKGIGSIAAFQVVRAVGFEVWPEHLVKRGPVLVSKKTWDETK